MFRVLYIQKTSTSDNLLLRVLRLYEVVLKHSSNFTFYIIQFSSSWFDHTLIGSQLFHNALTAGHIVPGTSRIYVVRWEFGGVTGRNGEWVNKKDSD
jgi:hypothetical protein